MIFKELSPRTKKASGVRLPARKRINYDKIYALVDRVEAIRMLIAFVIYRVYVISDGCKEYILK